MAALTFQKLLLQMQRACAMGDRKFLAQTLALFRFDTQNSPRFVEFVNHTMDAKCQQFFKANAILDDTQPVLQVAINGTPF